MVISALILQLSGFFLKPIDTINLLFTFRSIIREKMAPIWLQTVFNLKPCFHFREGFRVREVLFSIDSSEFSGFSTLWEDHVWGQSCLC